MWQWIELSVIVILLAWDTPWDFATYSQQLRGVSINEMEKTVTGGVFASPLPRAVEKALDQNVLPIMIGPEVAFLDLYVASGYLSPAERSKIVEDSRTWTVESESRPVLILALEPPYTVQPNAAKEVEERALSVLRWAKSQKNDVSIPLGLFRAWIVP